LPSGKLVLRNTEGYPDSCCFISLHRFQEDVVMRSRACLAAIFGGAMWLAFAARAGSQDAAMQREINEAIDRGVAHLRGLQDKEGRWPRPEIGATALAAWTLLETGATANDPAVRKAAKLLREYCIGEAGTYSVALAILFFDRLGDPVDEPLIQSLAFRLMASQGKTGGWNYAVVRPPPSETERLQRHYKQAQESSDEARKAQRKPGNRNPLSPEINVQLMKLFQGGLVFEHDGDNSNTQFAMLALWVARRHGLPVDRSLAMVERRFRSTQNQVGYWNYQYGATMLPDEALRGQIGSVCAMTSAGVLSLALTHPAGNKAAGRELTKDPQVKAGLAAVAAMIGTPQADRRNIAQFVKGDGRNFGRDQGCYCLWTLERMAVVYDLKTIGNKDWYLWGAQILLANQQPDGSWQSDCPGGGCDTCFALLFLKRANVAHDLTATLKGKVRDPGNASPPLLIMIGKQDAGGAENSRPAAREVQPGSAEKSDAGGSSSLAGDAGKLWAEVVDAAPAQQDALLDKLRDTPGPAYTEALAGAVVKLRGTAKTRARLALVQRFERLDAEVLRVHLKATEAEMRRAAAVASGAKKTRELCPELIGLLEDQATTVVQAAHAALRQISGQDFGPELDASPAERAVAVDAWRKWWKQQKQ
jgi:hypothetical protein